MESLVEGRSDKKRENATAGGSRGMTVFLDAGKQFRPHTVGISFLRAAVQYPLPMFACSERTSVIGSMRDRMLWRGIAGADDSADQDNQG
jgi:hypothetical protein